MDLIDSDFSTDLCKDKQRELIKNGSNNGTNCFEANGSSGSVIGDNRSDNKKEVNEKVADVKEDPDESEITEVLSSSNNSPVNEKSSPPQQSDKDVPSIIGNPTSCKGVKPDNGDNADSNFRNESCDNVLPISLATEALHEGVQPLPSNVVSKQPVTMEAQYMQQQSQIFVFSTALANKAAEAVMQGQYSSIISYHCAQPRTKKYLEGTNQQNQMLPNACGTNMTVDQNSGKGPIPSHPNLMGNHPNSLLNEAMMPLDLNQEMGMAAPQPLAGVKVPDENLTPQQRQHREEQLATLRKMHQILFPEALPGPEDTQTGAPHVEESSLSENLDLSKTPSSQSEWHKLQMQFYDDQKSRKTRTNGPPPSYQQATRSASVPIALQSPNPSSPNNTTSNLSLPSPRTCSGINSPADKVSRVPGPSPTMESPNPGRNTNSNPPTPVSSHLSPKHKDKLGVSNEFSPSSTVSAQNSQQSPAESMYCRSVQSIGQKQGSNNPKEPNLMPVPSPQQIQYLNTFEGQELTIQKQPNTSLKDTTPRKSPGSPPKTSQSMTPKLSSQSVLSATNDQSISAVCRFGYECEESPEVESPKRKGNNIDEHVTAHLGSKQMLQQSSLESVLPNNNTKPAEMPTKVSSSPAPSTPEVNRTFSSDISTGETTPDASNNQTSRKLDVAFCNSPQTNDRCHMGMQTNYMQKCTPFVDNASSKCGTSSDKELSAPNFQCIGPDNVPLNPNRINTTTANKPSHFDPISSLAQMSQQLTNNVPNSPVSQQNMMQNMHQSMPPFSASNPNQHLMMTEMHHIPNTAAPDHRLQSQMQPHFNTSRSQCNSVVSPGMSVSPKMMQTYGPQRPIPRGINYNGASIQVKPNAPNTIQYLPSRPQAASVPRGPPSLEFLQRFSNPLSNLESKLPSHNLQYFPNNYPQNNMNDMGMCSPHGNIRGPIRPPGAAMMRMQSPQMGFSNPEPFQNSNCQLFGASSKNPTLGLAPDASQPLPPSMGQNNNFKNTNFIGPTTTDPNYAQQFHNFQQQLYATNTRGQLNSQNMGQNQHYFIPK